MRFTQSLIVAVAAAMAVLVSAGPATAHGYNGNSISAFFPDSHGYTGAWPLTITRSQRDNGTGCLTLNGGTSGQASLTFGSQKYPYGSFVVVNGILMANITEPLYGQNGALMFVVHASRGKITPGVFEDIRGGSNFDFGTLTFGTKNGC